MTKHFNSLGIFPSSLEHELVHALEDFSKNDVLRRLWEHDYTLWSDSGNEIENRLGWLHLHETMLQKLPQIDMFVQQIQNRNFERVILLGMGGSILAPDVFQKIFGNKKGYPELMILDSTDPGAILNIESILNLEKTLFIVATKSGGTVETLSLFKYFYTLLSNQIGVENVGSHFVAITDPGSKLELLGKKLHFREIFSNDPNIGGRYSALSFFGLVPAALIGIDTQRLLEEAKRGALDNNAYKKPQNSLAAVLGCFLGVAAQKGKDKLTLISDEAISSFSDWIEQLVAESTGKSGRGILPVVGEEIAEDLSFYGLDRIFIFHQFNETKRLDDLAKKLQKVGHPVVQFRIENKYQLGGLMLTWEIATSLAGHIMNIHPFNQPNVESAKILANQSVQSFKEKGQLPDTSASSLTLTTINDFFSDVQKGDYINIQAYVTPTLQSEKAFRVLQAILRNKYKVAVTFGFGPRFLHSTGQLHKGDAGRGFFLQFVSTTFKDLDIPTQAGTSESFISFDILKKAQALGDAKALIQANRRLVTFSLQEPINQTIIDLASRIK